MKFVLFISFFGLLSGVILASCGIVFPAPMYFLINIPIAIAIGLIGSYLFPPGE